MDFAFAGSSMDLSTLLCLSLSLILIVTSSDGEMNVTHCPNDCSQILCEPYITFKNERGAIVKLPRTKYLKKFCRNGIVYGPCGCCQVCAKGLDEPCAPSHGRTAGTSLGKCGDGLYCDERSPFGGKCTPKKTVSLVPAARNSDKRCKPRCTYKYCSVQKNPSSTICSAAKNGVVKQSCQGSCQHTSCAACYHKVHKHPKLLRCSHDDFQCMRTFAKSFKNFYCNKHKYPCKPNSITKAFRKKFVCHIPRCAN